jgi:hypothetical protein
MTPFRIILFSLLILYSLALLYVEWRFGQPVVRHFFTDIDGIHKSVIPHFPFYGINTTLSAFTLWATALLFAIGLLIIDPIQKLQEWRFFISQIVMFTYFGFDDRFMIHEALYHGDLILTGLGFIELCCLILWGQLKTRPRQALLYLYVGVVWAVIMLSVDLILPSRLPLRLAGEDLAKLWGVVCLFFFAWEILMENIFTFKESNMPTTAYKSFKKEKL